MYQMHYFIDEVRKAIKVIAYEYGFNAEYSFSRFFKINADLHNGIRSSGICLIG
jgi:transcriptional regulator GlxA family with amidase domain